MEIPAFDRSIRECSSILLEFGIDVYKLLQSSAKEQYEKNTLNCMLAITAIQVIYPFSFLKFVILASAIDTLIFCLFFSTSFSPVIYPPAGRLA